MTPPRVKRRCWRQECANWIELDPFSPEEDSERHYCSPACEHKDVLDIRGSAAHGHTSSSLDDSIALALDRLREVLKPGRLSIALETRTVYKNRMRFLWIDCLADEHGDLATVPDSHAEALMQALLPELNEWRKSCQRSAIGDRRNARAKGAAA